MLSQEELVYLEDLKSKRLLPHEQHWLVCKIEMLHRDLSIMTVERNSLIQMLDTLSKSDKHDQQL